MQYFSFYGVVKVCKILLIFSFRSLYSKARYSEALQFTRNVVFMEIYTQNTDVKWLILGWRWSDNVAGERMKAFSTCQLWSSVKSEVNPLTSNDVTLSFTNYQLFHMRNLSLHCYKTTFLLQSVTHHIGLARSFTPKYAYNTRKP